MKQNTTSQRIAADLKQKIRSGRIAPGARVPSARELVREHGVALATASKVLAILRKEGLVRAQPGIGTIVRANERGSSLGRDQIVRAAVSIADEEGLAAATMRQVAVELGVVTVTVQSHFESRDDLLLAMADAVLGEMPVPRNAQNDWRGTLELVARAQWAGYQQHPWMVSILSMTRPQLLPNGMAQTEAVLTALDVLGLGPTTTLRTAVTLLAYIRGMAVGLEAERQAQQDTGMNSDEWMEARESLFAPFVSRFPRLARVTHIGNVDMSLDALFERGLALLLDGLAASAVKKKK